MSFTFYKYQGTGNDFVVIDNRDFSFPKSNNALIQQLCNRRFGVGADGLILLEPSKESDFTMVYFNANGNEGSMCGNGGRCIVAFAKKLGIIKQKTTFTAVDGLHYATIKNKEVSLQMIDVTTIKTTPTYQFLNTGSPHHVCFHNTIDNINVQKEGAKIRYGAPYFETGTNVNFAEKTAEDTFKIRTYERGVENETLACGTGATAVAIAAHKTNETTKSALYIHVLGGELKITFTPSNGKYKNIFLTGATQQVFRGTINI